MIQPIYAHPLAPPTHGVQEQLVARYGRAHAERIRKKLLQQYQAGVVPPGQWVYGYTATAVDNPTGPYWLVPSVLPDLPYDPRHPRIASSLGCRTRLLSSVGEHGLYAVRAVGPLDPSEPPMIFLSKGDDVVLIELRT